MEKFEVRFNVIHNIDKKSDQNISYTTESNCHTQHGQVVIQNFKKILCLVSHKVK